MGGTRTRWVLMPLAVGLLCCCSSADGKPQRSSVKDVVEACQSVAKLSEDFDVARTLSEDTTGFSASFEELAADLDGDAEVLREDLELLVEGLQPTKDPDRRYVSIAKQIHGFTGLVITCDEHDAGVRIEY